MSHQLPDAQAQRNTLPAEVRSPIYRHFAIGQIYKHFDQVVRIQDFRDAETANVKILTSGEEGTVNLVDLNEIEEDVGSHPPSEGGATSKVVDPCLNLSSQFLSDLISTVHGLADEGSEIPNRVIKAEAKKLSISATKLRVVIRGYRLNGVVVYRYQRGRKSHGKYLPVPYERIVSKAIAEVYETTRECTISAVERAVETACTVERLEKIPSRTAIKARIESISPFNLAHNRGDRELQRATRLINGNYNAEFPLDVCQIDFTVSDMVIVDNLSRRPIGRPLLGLAIDMAARAIPAAWLFLEAPSRFTAGWMMVQIVMPKTKLVESLNCSEFPWPVYGRFRKVYVDNGFRIKEFISACAEHSIDLAFRQPGEPQSGGMIERLIGTFVGKMHLLPGTTYANPLTRKKKQYDPEKEATYSLREAMQFLTSEIHRYHHTPHRSLDGRTPLEVWNAGLVRNGKLALPEIPRDPKQYLIPFLWNDTCTVGRHGITLSSRTYRSDLLREHVGRRLKVFYNRNNPSEVYPEIDHGKRIVIPLVEDIGPRISYWEHRWARLNRVPSESAVENRAERAKAVLFQQRLALQAQMCTAAARSEDRNLFLESRIKPVLSSPESAPDFSKPARRLLTSTWEEDL